MTNNLTMGSLFAGVGGFDIAAKRARIDVVWSSENDKHASAVLAEHFPTVPNYGDIHDIKDAPKVDILAGGFPCPSYSVAGNRGGLADDRGALWWEFHRLISEGQPTWVLGENVPGLLSSSGGRDFTTIVKSLVQLGYGVVWRVLDAQWFGVAQRRKRVLIVGHSGGQPRPEVLALAESLCGHPAPSRPAGTVTSALTRNGVGGGGGPDDNAAQANHLIPSGAFRWKENRNHVQLDDPTTALTVEQTQAVITPQVRRLTPTECERLQGFQDQWTATQSDTQRYRQMGNAVAVPVAEWVMRRIAAAEKGDK